MFRRFLILLLIPAGRSRQPRSRRASTAIQPELVAGRARAAPAARSTWRSSCGRKPGWHGYWLNPGDAGLPMSVDWQLPPGVAAGPLRYPVPTRLTIAGLMNYVYERDYAVLVRLKVPAGASGMIPIRAAARWLACTDKICVPEAGTIALDLPVGAGPPTERARFDEWRRALATTARVSGAIRASAATACFVAIPLPRKLTLGDSYVFPADRRSGRLCRAAISGVTATMVADLRGNAGNPLILRRAGAGRRARPGIHGEAGVVPDGCRQSLVGANVVLAGSSAHCSAGSCST